MASLQNTTVSGTLTATTSMQSPYLITSTSDNWREYQGSASIPSSINNATNYVDLFANTGAYERMYGTVRFIVYQSQIQCGSFYFQLSEYGLSVSTLYDSTGGAYWSVSRYSPATYTNYIRFTNTVGTSWGNGAYYFNVRWCGLGGATWSSSYITTRIR